MRDGLSGELLRMDGSSYGRYKSLAGTWRMDGFALEVVRAQSDPYAPPSRMAVRLDRTGIPAGLTTSPVRRRALASWFARRARAALRGPAFRVDAGGQEVLDRASCQVSADGAVTLRFGAELPGRGRRIDGRAAERALCRTLPEAVHAALDWDGFDEGDQKDAEHFADTVEDSAALREALPGLGLVAFVADGAVLPRRSGVDERPLAGAAAVPFASPPELRVEIELPHAGRVSGMGVPEGVTLVVGGGFHGKSTLLRALEAGVYDHVPGDGRELAVARADTVKVRAEDGRRVQRVDVHAFVDHLPSGGSTADFSTENASGSTSQAASLVEAVEAGAKVLLVDEDTAATNLMIRDARMQALVAKDREPLTPFVDLIRSLHRDLGVSTVLVMGGSGDYLDVADRVVMMDAYRPSDVTERARALAAAPAGRTGRTPEADVFPPVAHRVVDPRSVDSASHRGRTRIKPHGTDTLTFGEEDIDLRCVAQLADAGQVAGVGLALELAVRRGAVDGRRTVAEALDLLAEGLTAAALLGVRDEDFAVPRRFEVAAAMNRLRSLRVSALRGAPQGRG